MPSFIKPPYGGFIFESPQPGMDNGRGGYDWAESQENTRGRWDGRAFSLPDQVSEKELVNKTEIPCLVVPGIYRSALAVAGSMAGIVVLACSPTGSTGGQTRAINC